MPEPKKTDENLSDTYESNIEDIIKTMKKDKAFKQYLKVNSIKDKDIKVNILDFYVLYNNLKTIGSSPIEYIIKRDDKNRLYFMENFRSNDAGIRAKINHNTWFSDISEMDSEVLNHELNVESVPRQKILQYKLDADLLGTHYKYLEELKSFYIYGSSGSGKTFILSYFAKLFALKNYKVAYIQLPKLFNYIANEIARKSNSLNDIKTKLSEVHVLFLDDLGDEKDSAWFRTEFLSQIINERQKLKKLTYFSSSLSLYQLERLYNRQNTNVSHILKKMIERIRRNVDAEIKL